MLCWKDWSEAKGILLGGCQNNQVERWMMGVHNDNLSVDFGYILKAEVTEYASELAVDCGKRERIKDKQDFSAWVVRRIELPSTEMEKAIGGVGFWAKTKDPVLDILSFRY